MKRLALLACAGCICFGSGCGMLTVKHEIKPIYATINVNIRIQKELEGFFDFEEERYADAAPAKKGTP
jgi:hypothetical protein